MITVFFPSRGREKSMLRACVSLLARASQPCQLLVAVDPDETYEQVRGIGFIEVPERYGYSGQQHYYNAMLRYALGDWLMLFGDDAVMQTRHWDRCIREQPRPAVLWPKSNGYPYCFPVVPAAWARALGRFSPSAHPDSYWYSVGKGLDRHVDLDYVQIHHDRKDLTGGHDDATYAEGRGMLGQTGMADDGGAELVAKDVEVIRRLLA